MGKSDRLRLPLTVSAGYILLVGLVQLFPPLAEVVFSRPVVDPAVESLYGTGLLALGGFAMHLALDPRRAMAPVLILMAGFLLGAADLVFYWTLGQYDAGTALVPVILNLVLCAWIGTTLLRSTKEEAPAGLS